MKQPAIMLIKQHKNYGGNSYSALPAFFTLLLNAGKNVDLPVNTKKNNILITTSMCNTLK